MDDEVALETEAAQLEKVSIKVPASVVILTYALDSFTLLLGDVDSVSTRGQGSVVVCILHKQLHKLLRMLLNQLGQLRITRIHLLEDRLEHLRLLLHNLSQLLELRVVAQESQAIGAESTSRFSGAGCTTRASTSVASPSGLRSLFEEVYRGIAPLSRGAGVTTPGRWRRRRDRSLRG